MGRRLGEPDDPLLVSVRSGAKFSMPGMMETVLNIGLNDESVQGLAKQAGNERFAWDSYRRLIQMFGKTVLGIDGEHFEARPRRGQEGQGHRERPRPRRGRPAQPGRHVQGHRPRAHRPRLPAGPARADGPRRTRGLRLVERAAGDPLPPPGAHPGRPRHRGQRLLDGLRQPRHGLRHRRGVHPRPGHRPAGRLRRLPAERAGRGRRRRHPQHGAAARPRGDRQAGVRRAAGDHGEAGEPLPRPVRHRVHHRARQAVDAADPGRQAHRGRGVPHRHPARRRGPHRPRRGAHPGHRRPARPADVPALRRLRRRASRSPRA